MKKFFKWATLIVVATSIGAGVYYYYIVPEGSLNPIYLVPNDAIYIIETEEPIENWKKISSQEWWKHLRKNDYFGQLTESANGLDSLISNNETLFKMLGSRKLLVSAHVTKRKTYDFLYIVDLQKASKFKAIQSFFTKMVGKGFKVTNREYNGFTITELYDKEYRETLYLSFVSSQLIASYTHTLIEKSIDESKKPSIGRDLNFIEINKEVENKDMARIYLQYNYLDDYMACYSDEENEYINLFSESMFYSGLTLEMTDENLISLKGYTNISDTIHTYLLAMANSGNSNITTQKVASQRTATLMGLGFDSFSEFYDNLDLVLQEDKVTYDQYQKDIQKLEGFLGISLKDNFFSWIGNELAIINSEPVLSSKDNEFALVFKANDIDDAKENLAFISKKIRRRTPTRFKEVEYKGHTINFLSVKGLFKMMLGKMFGKLDKPYFTFIDDYVIFSNHPQTLKNMIDDYLSKNTLENSEGFSDFYSQFNEKSNAFFYINTPVLHKNLKEFVDAETMKSLTQNKEFMICFQQVGFQITKDGNWFETNFIIQYKDPSKVQKDVENIFELSMKSHENSPFIMVEELVENEIELSEVQLDDLSAKKQTETYENGNPKIEVSIKNGLKHGSYYEYYSSGEVKIKGKYKEDLKVGTWKVYDSLGVMLQKEKF